MQQLHDTVYATLDRAESDVATVYKIEDSAKSRATSESNDLYSGFPIKVEVLNWKDSAKAKESASTIDSTVTLKYRVSSMNLKPLVKVGFVAAAVILIALALFLNIPTARAVSIEQIYKALERAANVYIASFVPGKKEPVQEQWVSRTFKVHQIKTKDELVLWDIPNRVRRVKHLDSGLVEATNLSVEINTAIEKMIAGSLGLVPFTDLSLVPKDAKWSRVTNDNLEAVAEDIEVHDLTWLEKAYDGSNVLWKWRVFVDVKMNLPQRVEWYTKLATDNDYILRSTNKVEYLDDIKMQEVIKEASF
jgi:hypothetical protein